MEHSYSVEKGQLLLNNSRKNILSLYFFYFCRFFTGMIIVGSILISIYITYYIFTKCIMTDDLNEYISLGAIFATFGSAVISVCSLYCNEQMNLFQENLNIMHNQIPQLNSWQRWPFIRRHSKEKTSSKHYDYYILMNPLIVFRSTDLKLAVPIPSCTIDFKDLPIIRNFVKMLLFQRHYAKAIFHSGSTEQQTDLFMFHCILMIYKNIIRYKIGSILMWLGGEFVFTSILFSFFYRQMEGFLAFFIAKLQGIILTIMTGWT